MTADEKEPRCGPCSRREHGACEGGGCECPSLRCRRAADGEERARGERAAVYGDIRDGG